MTEKRNGIERRKALRENAEALLGNLVTPKPDAQASEVLMHELLVHKVELEMQNEELQRAFTSLEESRDRYVDFYEFAPVAYISVSRGGLISEINLTGCLMLGIERFRIISRRLSNYVAPSDRDHWHRLFMQMMDNKENEKHAFDLQMVHADGSTFYAFLNCNRRQIKDSPIELHIVLTDISKLKQAAD